MASLGHAGHRIHLSEGVHETGSSAPEWCAWRSSLVSAASENGEYDQNDGRHAAMASSKQCRPRGS